MGCQSIGRGPGVAWQPEEVVDHLQRALPSQGMSAELDALMLLLGWQVEAVGMQPRVAAVHLLLADGDHGLQHYLGSRQLHLR